MDEQCWCRFFRPYRWRMLTHQLSLPIAIMALGHRRRDNCDEPAWRSRICPPRRGLALCEPPNWRAHLAPLVRLQTLRASPNTVCGVPFLADSENSLRLGPCAAGLWLVTSHSAGRVAGGAAQCFRVARTPLPAARINTRATSAWLHHNRPRRMIAMVPPSCRSFYFTYLHSGTMRFFQFRLG